MAAVVRVVLSAWVVLATGPDCSKGQCPCNAKQAALIEEFRNNVCLRPQESNLDYDPANGLGEKIVMEMLDWPSQWISNLVSSIVLREVLNYDVNFTCASSGHNANARIANGFSDALIEFWLETYEVEAIDYIYRQGLVKDMGFIGYSGRSGVYIPDYTVEIYNNSLNFSTSQGGSEYTQFVSNTREFWRTFLVPEVVELYATQNDTDIVNALGGSPDNIFTPPWCNPWRSDGVGNNCIDIKAEVQAIDIGQLHQVIINLKLRVTISYWGTVGLETYISRKMESREALVFKYWVPEAFMAGLPVERVLFPIYTSTCHRNNTGSLAGYGSVDCDYPRVSIRKILTSRITESSDKEVYEGLMYYLLRFNITAQEMDAMLRQEHNRSSSIQNLTTEFHLACDFIRNNTDRLPLWVKSISCGLGESVQNGVCSPPDLKENKNQIDQPAYATGLVFVGMILSLAFFCLVWTRWSLKTPIVKAAQPKFLLQIILGCVISTSSIVFAGMDDGRNSTSTASFACNATLWLYCIGFCVTYTGLLGKIWTVKKLLVMKNVKKVIVSTADILKIFISGMSVESMMLTLWTSIDGFEYKRVCIAHDTYGRCSESRGYCSAGNVWSIVGPVAAVHVTAMIYALVLCYQCRNVPDVLAETSWITTAMISNFQVTVMGLLILFMVRENASFLYLCMTLLIALSDGSILGLVFLPKLYHSYFHPNDLEEKKILSGIGEKVKTQQKDYIEHSRSRREPDSPRKLKNRSLRAMTSPNNASNLWSISIAGGLKRSPSGSRLRRIQRIEEGSSGTLSPVPDKDQKALGQTGSWGSDMSCGTPSVIPRTNNRTTHRPTPSINRFALTRTTKNRRSSFPDRLRGTTSPK